MSSTYSSKTSFNLIPVSNGSGNVNPPESISFLIAITNTRSRFCGTPQSFPLITDQYVLKPSSPKTSIKLLKSSINFLLTRFFTFSNIRYFGNVPLSFALFKRLILSHSKLLLVPLSGFKPFIFPATDISWQQKLIVQKSAYGNSLILLISPRLFVNLQANQYFSKSFFFLFISLNQSKNLFFSGSYPKLISVRYWAISSLDG